MANLYFAMFWGRTDVYAKRGRNGGYFPQCDNRWNDRLCPKQRGEKISCEDCENTQWTKLTAKKIIDHLIGYKEDGSDVLGLYPLLPDGTCRFIVFDFDNHEKGAEANDFANVDEEWHNEVDALRIICEKNGITPLVERSRSGKGAHVWIFFKKPISASLARNFGFLLLDRGQASISMKSFQYYDRMYPCQNVTGSIGNLIALPLQGQALKNGNSAFVDKNWNAYPDQWDILLNHTEKLSIEDIEGYMQKWKAEIYETTGINTADITDRPKLWKKKQAFNKSDVIGKIHIVQELPEWAGPEDYIKLTGDKMPEYEVQEGDSLWRISERFYGTGYKWTIIVRAEDVPKDPNYLLVGETGMGWGDGVIPNVGADKWEYHYLHNLFEAAREQFGT